MNSKKFLAVVLCVLIVFNIFGCKKNNVVETTTSIQETIQETTTEEVKQKVYNVGIGQFAQHPSLDNCRTGFIEGLKEEGFVEGQNIVFSYDNADTNGGFANQIYSNYINRNMDMIVAIATPMAQAAYSLSRDTNIPTIFTAVTDPIAAELADENGMPIGNITGTSDKLAVEDQIALIREMFPDSKKIGILYTTSEVNSISSINEFKQIAGTYGFEIIDKGINDTSEMPLACDNLLNEVDVVTNVLDNTIVASLPILLNKAKEKNIPVFGSELEQVKMGCIACMGLDYVELGKQTGRIAARILKGEANAKDIPFETIKNASLYINEEVAKNLNYDISVDIKDAATEIFKTIEIN